MSSEVIVSGNKRKSWGRREFLTGAGALAVAGMGIRAWKAQDENGMRAATFAARAASYSGDLQRPIADGLMAMGQGPARVSGKSVMLKPNLVEPSMDAPHVNTHPMVVLAAVEVFKRWGAREVFVAEGQGHCRDTDYVLEQSGLGEVLTHERIEFVDLNHDEVWARANPLGFTALTDLWLPATLKRADLIVSMPKMKTHHWAGVTLSMKNLFGVLPGVVYGWPKNVLHHAGIPGSILDINAAVRPHLAIIDGIIGMEGDGPIMGDPKAAGVLLIGDNAAAADATGTRLMGFDPRRIEYLSKASGRLGPIRRGHIEQRGEAIASLVQEFQPSPG